MMEKNNFLKSPKSDSETVCEYQITLELLATGHLLPEVAQLGNLYSSYYLSSLRGKFKIGEPYRKEFPLKS